MKRSALALVMVALVALPSFAAETMISNYNVKLYGFLLGEFQYDNHGNTGEELMIYANSSRTTASDFRAVAEGTRVGVNISDTGRMSAKIEADFGGTNNANQVHLRLRHAYVSHKIGSRSELLVGQTWNLTPLEFSSIANNIVMGYSGAIWGRSPQIRFSSRLADNFNVAIAVTRPTRYPVDNNGTASSRPAYQAMMTAKIAKATLSVGGVLGRWSNLVGNVEQTGNVDLVCAGFNLPVSIVTLNGQYWSGRNLDDYLGGCGNMGYDGREVRAHGGFGNVRITPQPRLWFNAGYGVDDPDDEFLANGNIVQNTTVYGNVNYKLFTNFTVTAEYAEMQTEYKVATPMLPDVRTNQRYSLVTKFDF